VDGLWARNLPPGRRDSHPRFPSRNVNFGAFCTNYTYLFLSNICEIAEVDRHNTLAISVKESLSKLQIFPRFCPLFPQHYEQSRALPLARPLLNHFTRSAPPGGTPPLISTRFASGVSGEECVINDGAEQTKHRACKDSACESTGSTREQKLNYQCDQDTQNTFDQKPSPERQIAPEMI
jgi:hypothetical protein